MINLRVENIKFPSNNITYIVILSNIDFNQVSFSLIKIDIEQESEWNESEIENDVTESLKKDNHRPNESLLFIIQFLYIFKFGFFFKFNGWNLIPFW